MWTRQCFFLKLTTSVAMRLLIERWVTEEGWCWGQGRRNEMRIIARAKSRWTKETVEALSQVVLSMYLLSTFILLLALCQALHCYAVEIQPWMWLTWRWSWWWVVVYSKQGRTWRKEARKVECVGIWWAEKSLCLGYTNHWMGEVGEMRLQRQAWVILCRVQLSVLQKNFGLYSKGICETI